MGHDGWIQRQAEADAFFAQFIDARPEVIYRVQGERGANLGAIVEEDKAFGYWARKMADREQRRIAREMEAWRTRQEQTDRLDALRTSAASTVAPSPVILPAPRIAFLTDAERIETARWWQRLADHRGTRTLLHRIRVEVRTAAAADRFAARATAAWQREQRAFERAEWQAVIARRSARPAVRRGYTWSAIPEDRALAIAIAVLDKQAGRPPQGRKQP